MFPWQETAYTFSFDAAPGGPPPPPLDIALLVDVSGSMTRSLPTMVAAAGQLAREILTSRPNDVRLAVIRFDTEAEVNASWTSDLRQVEAGLNNLKPWTQQTNPHRAFEEIDRLMALPPAKPSAKRVIIFYTDGALAECPPETCPGGPMSEEDMVVAARRLRAQGIEIYSVGTPEYGSAPLMFQVTGSAEHVMNPGDASDLASLFRAVVQGLEPFFGTGAQFSVPLDGRNFKILNADRPLYVSSDGTVTLDHGKLTRGTNIARISLEPTEPGYWRAGLAPAKLVYRGLDGRLVELTAARRPALLVVTWLILFLAGLPALLWAIYALTRRPRRVQLPDLPYPEIRRRRPPSPLPELPPVPARERPSVPTLFIGLGGAGRHALQAVRAELRESHVGAPGQPFQFLWVDVDRRERPPDETFGDWSGYPVEELVASAEESRIDDMISHPGAAPPELQWFPAIEYLDAARGVLEMGEGSRGDRRLARLSLFRWLSRSDSRLVAALARTCRTLEATPSVDDTRQVVVLASQDGGVGSGWVLDIGTLLRRVLRRDQTNGQVAFTPDLICILSDSASTERPENRSALQQESETAFLTGAYPQTLTFKAGDPLLDSTDTEPPFDLMVRVSGHDDDSIAAQASEAAAALVDRGPRPQLLDQAHSVFQGQAVPAVAHGVHTLPTLIRQEVHNQILRRTLGNDVLLDLDLDRRGGFRLRGYDEATVANALAQWAAETPVGTPWQALLQAAVDRGGESALGTFLRTMQVQAPPPVEWFTGMLCNEASERLHGSRRGDTWLRGWMPGLAVGVLRLLSSRLKDTVLGYLPAMGADQGLEELVSRVAENAGAAADGLERWSKRTGELLYERLTLTPALQSDLPRLQALANRKYVVPDLAPAMVESEVRGAFEAWIGHPDLTGALRERLFFSIVEDDPAPRVIVRSHVTDPQGFDREEDLLQFVDEHAVAVARLAPALELAPVLLETSAEQRDALALSLVENAPDSLKTLSTFPNPRRGEQRRNAALHDFQESVERQVPLGGHQVARSEDRGAARLFGLVRAVAERARAVYYARAAEQAAEQMRLRIERIYERPVPRLPSHLRIALAHPGAFRSFARDYSEGHIFLKRDTSGAEQWYFDAQDRFLTMGEGRSLAAAAANYCWYVGAIPPSSAQPEQGDFSRLEQWQSAGGVPAEDTVVLAAIRMVTGG